MNQNKRAADRLAGDLASQEIRACSCRAFSPVDGIFSTGDEALFRESLQHFRRKFGVNYCLYIGKAAREVQVRNACTEGVVRKIPNTLRGSLFDRLSTIKYAKRY